MLVHTFANHSHHLEYNYCLAVSCVILLHKSTSSFLSNVYIGLTMLTVDVDLVLYQFNIDLRYHK